MHAYGCGFVGIRAATITEVLSKKSNFGPNSLLKSARNFSIQELIYLTSVYTVAWGPLLLLNKTIFWDDWVFETSSHEVLRNIYSVRGTPYEFWYWSTGWMLSPLFFRFVTFFSYLIGSILFGLILFKLPERIFTRNSIVSIIAISLVLPLNLARGSNCTSHYALTFLIFHCAWYLMITSKTKLKTSAAFALFAYSFTTNSLLFYFIWPFVHFLYLGFKNNYSNKKLILRQITLACLPITWFGLKRLLFVPFGSAAGYNDLIYKYVIIGFLVFFLIALAALRWYCLEHIAPFADGAKIFLILFGITVLASGMLPYFSVGYFPPYVSWNTRHEFLQSSGISIIVLGFSMLISSIGMHRIGQYIPKLVIGIAMTASFLYSLSFLNDASKQKTIIDLIAMNSLVSESSTIIFDDTTTKSNIFDRPYDSTEWTGFLHKAFGDSTRFGLNANQFEIDRLFNSDFVNNESAFSVPGYVVGKSAILVTIYYLEPVNDSLDDIPLLRYFAFNRPKLGIRSQFVTKTEILARGLADPNL